MPDGQDMTTLQQTAQRGRFPGAGFPRTGFPRGRVPRGRVPRARFPRGRFPRVAPIRRAPGFFVPPVFIGFPRERCYFVDRFGRCCDRFGRCCDRFGRCEYIGFPYAGAAGAVDDWYGVPGGWDMMPDIYAEADMDEMAYDDMVDYDEV